MKKQLSLPLLTMLLMFPQVVETIYSPALTQIANGFNVNAEQASQTLSLYFFAFAFGIVFWGRICDLFGRRSAVLAGLSIYAIACLIALYCTEFNILLLARVFAAFGAAVGSIATQTIIRDSFYGTALNRIFAIMGIALAISPGIGLFSGSLLTELYGYRGVFSALSLLAILLIAWSVVRLPETKPNDIAIAPIMKTLLLMVKDRHILAIALLIALFNINLFSYYQLAPFIFAQLQLSTVILGYSGGLLTLGCLLGAWFNQRMLKLGHSSTRLINLSVIISLLSSLIVMLLLLNHNSYFVFAVVFIVMAYSIAIPNILAYALINYRDRLGTAGAILGLFYYTLLAIGLALSGWSQNLGAVLICSNLLALPLVFYLRR